MTHFVRLINYTWYTLIIHRLYNRGIIFLNLWALLALAEIIVVSILCIIPTPRTYYSLFPLICRIWCIAANLARLNLLKRHGRARNNIHPSCACYSNFLGQRSFIRALIHQGLSREPDSPPERDRGYSWNYLSRACFADGEQATCCRNEPQSSRGMGGCCDLL